ncbi:hypothetical protein [Paenibacillus sedimenti]|uniref:Uncharacterized protein n=1 Tax=Paenibacillus sedimenti TaxID=2770274 RepID=A0A926KNP7_9BACL|nr:hypothetical protein [Paenibacillus sedimenti]MBD0381199.1 hypothetical protein [Paenibacillus sedimenti]
MTAVKHAEIRGFTERNDVHCADIEVKVEGFKDVFLAEFTGSRDNDFDMTHVYRKDASEEIDWYDNNLHEALKDVSEEMFQNEAGETIWAKREEFKEGILTFGTIRKELNEHFQLLRKASLFHNEDNREQTFLH